MRRRNEVKGCMKVGREAYCISTFWGGYPSSRKMRNVLAKVGEQPWTPSLMYGAPKSLGSIFMELAMPPVTCSFSKTMTVNLSGCFDKAYAAERPAAPAPTMATRWVFMFVVGKSCVVRSKQLKGKRKEYKFTGRMTQSSHGHTTNRTQSRHVQMQRSEYYNQ